MRRKHYFSSETHAGFMRDPHNFSRNTKVSVVLSAKFSWKDRSPGKCSKLHASWVTILVFLEKISRNLHENSSVIPVSLETLLRGKNAIFTQHSWKLELSRKLYCNTACGKVLMVLCVRDAGKCAENTTFHARHMQDSGVIHATFPATQRHQ